MISTKVFPKFLFPKLMDLVGQCVIGQMRSVPAGANRVIGVCDAIFTIKSHSEGTENIDNLDEL